MIILLVFVLRGLALGSLALLREDKYVCLLHFDANFFKKASLVAAKSSLWVANFNKRAIYSFGYALCTCGGCMLKCERGVHSEVGFEYGFDTSLSLSPAFPSVRVTSSMTHVDWDTDSNLSLN